jgi:hypothetical protein
VKATSRAGRLAPWAGALLAATALAGATAVSSAPRQPQSAQSPEPQALAVLFRAMLPDGRPFADLRVEDVEFKVNGKPRTPGSLLFVQPGRGEAARVVSELPPPFATNLRPPVLRDTIFVVETDSIGPGMTGAVQDAMRQFMQHLARHDRVGLVTIPLGGLNVGLTTDRAAIETAIATLSGRALRSETDVDAACRTRQVLDALMNLFRGAAHEPPATIVMFGGGLVPPMIYEMSKMSATPNLCEIRAKDYQEVELVMLGAPVDMHVVHVQDPTGSGASASTGQAQGLEGLAGLTGNRITRLVGSTEAAMASMAASTSAHYRLTYVPDDAERNGQAYPLSLKISRPDVVVVARSRVLVPEKRGTARKGGAPAPRDMLRVPDAYRDLPMRAAAFVSREGSDTKTRVVVMFEPAGPAASLNAAAVALYDQTGKLVAQATADRESLARTPPMVALVAGAGTYRMRVAATDGSGLAGAVDAAVDARLTGEGPLKLSSLVLGVAEEGRFAGRLQFYDEPTAVAYLEIYGVPRGELTAELQLAGMEGGPPAVRGAMRITGEPGDDRRVALGGIPIGALPAGDISVRAVVSVNGAEAGSVTRTLRKAER